MIYEAVEWVMIDSDVSIVAREGGQIWVHALNGTDLDSDPFAKSMTVAGTRGSTNGLLDAAINLGFKGIDVPADGVKPSLSHHILALVGAYHTSRDTPRNLRQAAARFRALGRPEVAALLDQKAIHETGHERLALKDLNALGLPGERLVANLVPASVKPLCDRFDSLCAKEYPIECIGLAYCFERIAALKQKSDIDAVKAIRPDGVDATRFLRAHSCLGTESCHVETMIDFVWRLPASDRISIVRETYETALLMAQGYHREGLLSDAEILELIHQATGETLPKHVRSHGEPRVAA